MLRFVVAAQALPERDVAARGGAAAAAEGGERVNDAYRRLPPASTAVDAGHTREDALQADVVSPSAARSGGLQRLAGRTGRVSSQDEQGALGFSGILEASGSGYVAGSDEDVVGSGLDKDVEMADAHGSDAAEHGYEGAVSGYTSHAQTTAWL